MFTLQESFDKKNNVDGLLLLSSLLTMIGVCPISSIRLCNWFKCSTELILVSPACPNISKDESTYINLFSSLVPPVNLNHFNKSKSIASLKHICVVLFITSPSFVFNTYCFILIF